MNKFLRSLIAVGALVASTVSAQLVPGVRSEGRADLDTLNVGYTVAPTRSLDGEGNPVQNNRVYLDGTYWSGSNTYPTEFDDGFTRQIVTDPSGYESVSSSYLTFSARRATDVYVCRDDDNSGAYDAGWTDTGLDVLAENSTLSCLLRRFDAGSVTLPGNDGDPGTAQFVIFARDATRPLSIASAGSVDFGAPTYTVSEDASLTFTVRRTGGTDGAASASAAITTGGAYGSLSGSTVFSWTDGVGGNINGTFNPADVDQDRQVVLTLTGLGGTSVSGNTTTTITIIDNDAAPPASAEDYYVNKDHGSCSDSNSGLDGTTNSWCTLGRANAVTAASDGDVYVHVYPASAGYINDQINPASGGVNASRRIIWIPEGGDVNLFGPTSGSMTHAINCNQPYFEIQASGSDRFVLNGQVSWGTGGGQVEKGEDPNARITQGLNIGDNCDNSLFDYDHINTAGWNGISIGSGSSNVTLRVNTDFHGTPYYGPGGDWGDTIWANIDYPNVWRMDGCYYSTGLTMDHPGHSLGHWQDGKLLANCLDMDGRWGDVPTFSSSNPVDGNRLFTMTRNLRRSQFHDIIMNGSGKAQDQNWQECYKHEGRENLLALFVIRNCHGQANNTAHAQWSSYAEHGRIAHGVFENIGGPVVILAKFTDSTCSGCGSNVAGTDLEDYVYKNIIVRDYMQDNCCTGWDKDIVFYVAQRGTNLEDVLQVHGATIEVGPGEDCSDAYVWSVGDRGKVSFQSLMSTDPDNFSNITCVEDVNLDSAPSYSTRVTIPNYVTQYTLAGDDTFSSGTGVNLTTATSGKGGSTALDVADALWFPDPDGVYTPNYGQFAGGYYVHIQGVGNVQYTNVTVNADNSGTITLATPQTWASGAGVNYKISSGSTPNRGAVL